MMSVRIRCEGIHKSLGCAILSLAGAIGFGLLAALRAGDISGGMVDILFPWVLPIAVLFLFYGSLTTVLWIELGPRLAYRTRLRTRSHEWADVKVIQFTHAAEQAQPLIGDDFIGFLAYSKIVITFVNGTSICEQICTRSQGFVDSETVIPVLVSALQADDPGIRRCAAEALGRFGPDAGLPLASAMKDEPADVREAMIEAIRRAGKYNALLRDATLHLEQAIGDEDSKVRTAVIEAVRSRRYQDSLARAFEEDEDKEASIERIAAADSDACLVCGQIIPEEARGCSRCGWTWEEVGE